VAQSRQGSLKPEGVDVKTNFLRNKNKYKTFGFHKRRGISETGYGLDNRGSVRCVLHTNYCLPNDYRGLFSHVTDDPILNLTAFGT